MKNWSIRVKITLWFAAALLLVVALAMVIVFYVSRTVLQKNVRDQLAQVVENNADEIYYIVDDQEVLNADKRDYFLGYRGGYLQIQSDFLDEVNGVTTGLYDREAILRYGENPIAQATEGIRFKDGEIQVRTVDGTKYYIMDRALDEEGVEGLWLRGIVSEDQGDSQLADIVQVSLILLPAVMILALLGGYLIAARAFRPIRQISQTAAQIGQEQDLKKRIALGDGRDEIHQLANTFDEMFERLDEAFTAEKKFTSDVSHELRTPMAVIMAQCEYTLEKERSGEEYREALQRIRRQGRKMSGLIEDMLQMTRLERGTERYALAPVELSRIAAAVCEDMAELRHHNITLKQEIEEGLWVEGNEELLLRLLTNLISNAYQYGKEGGSIRVTLQQQGEEVVLAVEDDGIGIAAEEQEKIFARFYQVDTSRTGHGTGLGLSMVQEIARLHGGCVEVQSEEGRGSRFIFRMKGEER